MTISAALKKGREYDACNGETLTLYARAAAAVFMMSGCCEAGPDNGLWSRGRYDASFFASYFCGRCVYILFFFFFVFWCLFSPGGCLSRRFSIVLLQFPFYSRGCLLSFHFSPDVRWSSCCGKNLYSLIFEFTRFSGVSNFKFADSQFSAQKSYRYIYIVCAREGKLHSPARKLASASFRFSEIWNSTPAESFVSFRRIFWEKYRKYLITVG